MFVPIKINTAFRCDIHQSTMALRVRSQIPVYGLTGLVIAEEFSQISRSLAIQNLKYIQENFESYPTRNWQPMESFEKSAGIYSPANSKDGTGCAVLEPLDSGMILR